MKCFFSFYIFCICFVASATAQLEEGFLAPPVDLNKFMPSQLDDYYADISIDNQLPADYKLPFSSINIIDCRQDTCKLGFIPAKFGKDGAQSYECIMVEKGLNHALEKELNKHYHQSFSSNNLKLAVVVKRLWADPFPNKKMQSEEDKDKSSLFNLYIGFEFFFEKDNLFYPFKRVDTLFRLYHGDKIPGCDDKSLKTCKIYGHAIANVFESVDFNFYAQRLGRIKNKLTKENLDSFNNTHNDYAIVKDSILQKGVYLSFDDFRNNNPSVKNYRRDILKKGLNKVIVLYNLDDPDQERIAKYWGYCDGENIFCKFTPYPLARFGNTFEFFMDKTEYYDSFVGLSLSFLSMAVGRLKNPTFFDSRGSNYILSEVRLPSTKVWISRAEPMQFDMETGKAY